MAIFPSDIAGSIESVDDLAKVRQYLRKLNDDLTYMFNNLTTENYSDSMPKLIFSTDENGEASFEVEAGGIRMQVASDEYVKSQVEILNDAISLKVSVGEVTDNLNSELLITGNSIALTTGHFTVNSTNLTIDAQGNATFSGTLSGTEIIGQRALSAGSNFYVSYDGYSDYDIGVGQFYFTYGAVHGHSMQNSGTTASAALAIEAATGDIYCHEIYPYTNGSRWSHGIAYWIDWLYEQVTGGGSGGGDDSGGGGDSGGDGDLNGDVTNDLGGG